MHDLGFQGKNELNCAEFKIMRCAAFKSGKHLAFEFKVNRGLRQGDAIAPLCFNVVLETAVRRCNAETGGTIFAKCQIMAYVDDVVIMGRRLQDVEVFTSLVKQTRSVLYLCTMHVVTLTLFKTNSCTYFKTHFHIHIY
jgi:hypothetical protein